MFAKEVYIRRRQALLEKMKGESGIILFLGNVESPAQYRDNCYKWRQDSSWLYFFGIDSPRFAATIDLESGVDQSMRMTSTLTTSSGRGLCLPSGSRPKASA